MHIVPLQIDGPESYSDERLAKSFSRFLGRLSGGDPNTVPRRLAYHSFMTQFKRRELDPRAAAEGKVVRTLTPEEIEAVLQDDKVNAAVMEVVGDPASWWDGGPHAVWVEVENFFGETAGHTYIHDSTPSPDYIDMAAAKAHASLFEGRPSAECKVVKLIKHDDLDRNWMGGRAFQDFGIGSSGLTEIADDKISAIITEALEEAKAAKNLLLAA